MVGYVTVGGRRSCESFLSDGELVWWQIITGGPAVWSFSVRRSWIFFIEKGWVGGCLSNGLNWSGGKRKWFFKIPMVEEALQSVRNLGTPCARLHVGIWIFLKCVVILWVYLCPTVKESGSLSCHYLIWIIYFLLLVVVQKIMIITQVIHTSSKKSQTS